MSVQLGLGLNRRQGGFNPFTPTHLNPYLLFDTRTSMLGELESPTLDLDAAVPSSLDVITATRSGVATYTDINGTIQTADPNTVRVDYVQGEELTPTVYQRVGYTDFSSGWYDANGATVSGTGSYNGSVTKEITAVGYSTYYTAVSTTASQVYNVSFYARLISGSASTIGIYRQHTETSFTNISLTSEWQRFDVAVTASGSTVNFGIAKSSGATDPVVFEITQPQFTEGADLRDFVPNTTGSPKFIASATYGPRVPMMLIEPSATNLLTQTDFSVGWSLAGSATIEQTTEPTPLPAQTALRLQSNGGISDRYQAPSGYPSGVSTASVYIKWDGVDTRFRIERGISNSRAEFNVTQGGVTHHSNTADGYSIEEHGDGWWRVSNTMTNPTWVQLYADVEDGDGSILMALPQHEAGTLATSFIPNPAPISDNLNTFTDVIDSDGSLVNIKNISIANLNGKTCEVEFEVFDYVSGSLQAYLGNLGGATQIPNSSVNITANGVYKGVKTANADYIQFRSASSDFVGKIRNISVVEVDTSGVRNADNLVIDGTAFSDFYNATEGTFYVESSTNLPSAAGASGGYIFQASYSVGNSYQDRHAAYYNDIKRLNVLSVTGGVTQYSKSSIVMDLNDQLTRLAYSYKQSDFRVSFNGEAEPSPTGNQVPSTDINQLHLGDTHAGHYPLKGHIKRFIYWPTHSDNL